MIIALVMFGEWLELRARHRTSDAVRALLVASIAASDEVLSAGSFDDLSVGLSRTGEQFSLRWVVLHLIEEYARHAGHADLLREGVDGATGE